MDDTTKTWPKGIEDTSEGRCDAALSIRGAGYRCDLSTHHEGWAHSSKDAESIWSSGTVTR